MSSNGRSQSGRGKTRPGRSSPYKAYSDRQLSAALNWFWKRRDQGEDVSVAALVHRYGHVIPPRTLRRHVANGVRKPEDRKRPGPPRLLTEEEEEELADVVLDYADAGTPMTKGAVSSLVLQFVEKNSLPRKG